MRALLTIVLLLSLGQLAKAQLVIDPSYTAAQLADIVVGDGIVVTNVVLNCPTGGSAFFDGSATNVGIPTGILLTSGSATVAATANNNTGGGVCSGAPGDPNVQVVANETTYDACILEFDIVPTCSVLNFTFVFGSEEYPEYINREFADAMVITVSGPGIVGVQNIAMVPGTATPVGINTVNSSDNNQYFVGGGSIQYDGFTTPLTASANVTSCERYHIKIAVADAADCIFDSGLFIAENSLDCGVSNAVMTDFTAGANQPIEGCRDYTIDFCRQGSTATAYNLNVSFAGVAVNGVDYTLLPNTIPFAVGEQCKTITITPIADGLLEGDEPLLFIYEAISGSCVVLDTIEILLRDDQGLTPDFYHNDVCDGNTVFFNNATTILPPATATLFTWKLGDGTEVTQYNYSYQYAIPGNYDAWLIATSTDGCVDSVMHTVNVYDYPEAAFTLGGDVCLSEPALFTNSSTPSTNDAMGQVSWNFGDGAGASTWDAAHTYSLPDTFPVVLTVSTQTLGCATILRDTIIVYPAVFTDYIFANVCLGNTVNFINQSNGNGTWEWDFGDGSPLETTFDVSHDFLFADTFDVRLVGISPNGCNDTTIQQVFVFDAPTPVFNAPNVCSNVLALFDNQSVAPTMGTLASWFWLFSDGTTASAFSPAHEFPAAGNYDATLIVYSSNLSCSDTLIRPITIYEVPIPEFAITNVCDGLPVEPIDQTVGNVALYEWDFGDASPIDNNQAPSHNYLATGVYPVWLQVTNADLCTDSIKHNVIVYSLPQAQFTTNIVCEGTPTVFFNQSGIGFPDNIVEWAWDFADGSPVELAVNPNHPFPEGGIYDVQLRVTSGNGCLDSITLPVTVYYAPTPDIIITVSEGCPPLCTQFYDASTIGSGGIVEWRWNFGDLQTSTNRNESHCYGNEEIFESAFYDVSLRTVSDNGCVATLELDSAIEAYAVPYSDFTWSPDSISMFDSRAFFEDGSYGADFWAWQFGDPNSNATSNQQSPTYQYTQHGTFPVMLIASNLTGCVDTMMKELTVYSDFRFYIPNTFTPNADDKNEYFYGKGEGILQYSMRIFDRWGKLIFESSEPSYQWDGVINGSPAQLGKYVYQFNIQDDNRNYHQFVGEIMLMR